MKYYYFILLFFCTATVLYAQDFSKEWQSVYQLEKAGSYKTAYEKVETIFKKAKRKKK